MLLSYRLNCVIINSNCVQLQERTNRYQSLHQQICGSEWWYAFWMHLGLANTVVNPTHKNQFFCENMTELSY